MGTGGPITPEGKSQSSQNAMKHGCRTKRLLVGDERQEDYEALEAGWRAEYGGEDGQANESLLQRVILNDWLLQRAERQYEEAAASLSEIHPLEWAAEQHHQLALFVRYKTTQERTFYRAFQALNALRKDKIREETALGRVRDQVQAIIREESKKNEKPKRRNRCGDDDEEYEPMGRHEVVVVKRGPYAHQTDWTPATDLARDAILEAD